MSKNKVSAAGDLALKKDALPPVAMRQMIATLYEAIARNVLPMSDDRIEWMVDYIHTKMSDSEVAKEWSFIQKGNVTKLVKLFKQLEDPAMQEEHAQKIQDMALLHAQIAEGIEKTKEAGKDVDPETFDALEKIIMDFADDFAAEMSGKKGLLHDEKKQLTQLTQGDDQAPLEASFALIKAFEEEELEQDESEGMDTPEDDDIFLTPSGQLGSMISVSAGGKFLGEFRENYEAEDAIKAWMDKNNFYPNIWEVSDHGNISPYTMESVDEMPPAPSEASANPALEKFDRLLIHDEESAVMGKPWVKLISGDPQGEAEREANRLFGQGEWSWKNDSIVSKDGDTIELADKNPVQGAIELGEDNLPVKSSGPEEVLFTPGDLSHLLDDSILRDKAIGANLRVLKLSPEKEKEYRELVYKLDDPSAKEAADKAIWEIHEGALGTTAVKATGEPDQQYDIEFFDAVAATLMEAGFEASHREFDKYQGVYLDVSKDGQKIDRFWVKDSFQQGNEKLNPAHKYKSAVMIDDTGEEVSANSGDYFMMQPDDVFEGCQLLLKDMQGNESTIEEPKKSDLPDLSQTKNTIEFEGEPDTVYVLVGEKMPPLEDSGVMVIQHPDKTVDIGELLEYLGAQIGAGPAPEAAPNL